MRTFQRSSTLVDGARVHAVHAGEGDDIILLHGLAGSSVWWRYTIPALAKKYAVHAPDLVGFGRSRGTRQPSMARTAESIAQWIAARGIGAAHVIGHSMGGEIAIHLTADYPELVRKLVLVSAAGIPRPITLAHAARFLAEIIPPRSWGSPRFLPRVAFDTLRAGPFNFARAAANIVTDDVRPLLPRITCPTLLVWGTLDALTPMHDGEIMAASIPNSRLSVFDGAAHMPMIDQRERFNREILEFIAS